MGNAELGMRKRGLTLPATPRAFPDSPAFDAGYSRAHEGNGYGRVWAPAQLASTKGVSWIVDNAAEWIDDKTEILGRALPDDEIESWSKVRY